MRFPLVSLPFFSLVRELSYWERRDATVVPAGGCLRSCLVRCVANGRDEAWRAAHREMGVWLRGTSFPILGFAFIRTTNVCRTDRWNGAESGTRTARYRGRFVCSPAFPAAESPQQGELGLILQAPINVNVASAKAHRSRPSPLTVAYTVSKSGPAGPQLFAGPSSLYIAVGLDGNRARFNGVSYSLVRQERKRSRTILLDPMSY